MMLVALTSKVKPRHQTAKKIERRQKWEPLNTSGVFCMANFNFFAPVIGPLLKKNCPSKLIGRKTQAIEWRQSSVSETFELMKLIGTFKLFNFQSI